MTMTDRKKVRVTPAPGRVVPDLDYGDTLPAEGRVVTRTPYWVRRIQDQDVTESPPEAADAAPATVKATKGGK
jgi:hypothetical protein